MNEQRIKSLVEILKTTIRELEDEVKSDPDSYLSFYDDYEPTFSDLITSEDTTKPRSVKYEDILTYYNSNDDDGEY